MSIKRVLLQVFVVGAMLVFAFTFGRFYQLTETPVRTEKEIVIEPMPSDQAMQACERMCLPSEHL